MFLIYRFVDLSNSLENLEFEKAEIKLFSLDSLCKRGFALDL